MEYVTLAVLIIIGLFGAGSIIGAGGIVSKLEPVKGIIGIVALVLGILAVLDFTFVASLYVIAYLAGIIAMIGLGIIFGTILIKQVTGSGAMDGIVAKLKAFEIILGIAALFAAVVSILAMIGVL